MSVEAAHVQGIGVPAVGEIETGVFGGQGELVERPLFRQDIAEGQPLVVGPEYDVHAPPGRPLFAQRNGHLVVAVSDHAPGADRIFPRRIPRPPVRADDLEIPIQRPGLEKV